MNVPGKEVDHVMLTGREVERRLKAYSHIGIVVRQNTDAEIAIGRPEVASMQGVTVR